MIIFGRMRAGPLGTYGNEMMSLFIAMVFFLIGAAITTVSAYLVSQKFALAHTIYSTISCVSNGAEDGTSSAESWRLSKRFHGFASGLRSYCSC